MNDRAKANKKSMQTKANDRVAQTGASSQCTSKPQGHESIKMCHVTYAQCKLLIVLHEIIQETSHCDLHFSFLVHTKVHIAGTSIAV